MDYSYVQTACNITGSCLLNPPTNELIKHINSEYHWNIDYDESIKVFSDVFVDANSKTFIPPFEHVCVAGKLDGDIYTFPKAKYSGGEHLREFYEIFNFNPSSLDISGEILRKHLPIDHFGIVLLFLSVIINDSNMKNSETKLLIIEFIKNRIDILSLYLELLKINLNPYVKFMCDMLTDSISELKQIVG